MRRTCFKKRLNNKRRIGCFGRKLGCVTKRRISWKKSNNERLGSKRNESGRGLKNFREVYKETKVRVACYMGAATNEWMR